MFPIVFLMVAATSSAPVPTPLKVIGHVSTSRTCSVLRTNVLQTIQGLKINDGMIAQSRLMFVKMGRDLIDSADGRGSAMLMDNMQMEQLANAIIQNLHRIDGLLSDRAEFSPNPQTNADKALASDRAQLQAVADEQQRTLNIIYGTAATYDMHELLGRGDGLNGAVGSQNSVNDSNVSFQSVLQSPGNPDSPALSASASFLANNPYARFYLGVAFEQVRLSSLEAAASAAVVRSVSYCR